MTIHHSKRLSLHISHYFIAQLLTIAGGFLTFPLLTRLLSKADYGILNLFNTAIGLCVIASKFGLQNATIRFLPRSQNKGTTQSGHIYSTVLLSNLYIALCLALLLFFLSPILFPNVDKTTLQYIVPCTAALVVVRSLYLCFLTFFRAKQNSLRVSLCQVANKYLTIILLFYLFFSFKANAIVFFSVLLCSELIILTGCSVIFIRESRVTFEAYSLPFLKKAITFGLPLLGFELITEFLAYGDRYLIQYFLGSEQLAVYSAGYNLADYVRSLLLYPLAFAATPIITEIWETKGKKATEKFVSESLGNFWYVLVPAIFGVSLLGGDLVVLLASEKYAESAQIIPYVIVGATLYGTFPLTGAGLFVTNHTNILFYLVLFAAVLNVILNLFFIPLYGIIGAAQSTLISYILLFFMIIAASKKYLYIRILKITIVKAFLGSILMVSLLIWSRSILSLINQNTFFWLSANIFLGTLFYAISILIMDKKIRYMAFQKINTFCNIN